MPLDHGVAGGRVDAVDVAYLVVEQLDLLLELIQLAGVGDFLRLCLGVQLLQLGGYLQQAVGVVLPLDPVVGNVDGKQRGSLVHLPAGFHHYLGHPPVVAGCHLGGVAVAELPLQGLGLGNGALYRLGRGDHRQGGVIHRLGDKGKQQQQRKKHHRQGQYKFLFCHNLFLTSTPNS